MQQVYSVAEVRQAEEAAMAVVGGEALMQNAAFGLAVTCLQRLQDRRGQVVGSRVVVLVGSGNNGGDALWAGSLLSGRGAAVIAITASDTYHQAGAAALLSAGGRIIGCDHPNIAGIFEMADLALDGLLGIGGRGAPRDDAAQLIRRVNSANLLRVAVDVPSGVDADSGAVADAAATFQADLTVTFGCLKPGLLVAPGSEFVGELQFVDIGLSEYLPHSQVKVLEVADVAADLPEPAAQDNKYSRGVVGVVAGSPPYPGAAVLCTGAARLGGAGMVRYAGSAPKAVADHWPEVVIAETGPAAAGRVQAWVVGPGGGTDQMAFDRLAEALTLDVPVVVDADGLTLLANHGELREELRRRHRQGHVTVLTPHEGEFQRLGMALRSGGEANRVDDARAAARELASVVLLKGHHTVVASPAGDVFINTVSSSALATAGSGDVLSGVLASILASDIAELDATSSAAAARSAACAAFVHGTAGVLAGSDDGVVTAMTVLEAIPAAISTIRHDGVYG